jgi:arylsulfatase A-like enzyme
MFGFIVSATAADKPNIVWIVIEDASPHISCYGETTIQTPHIDQLAADGVKFANAFVTCPVCSPSRSAMVTGMYQTTLGAHQHRSQRTSGLGGGTEEFVGSYEFPSSLKTIPQIFREAGYFVTNGGKSKTDYNFVHGDIYDGNDWSKRAEGQPFFAQYQLRRGKNRKATVANPVNTDDHTLPS